MADQEIAFKLTTKTGEAITSIKQLKTELKSATNEVFEMSQKFGETSKEALASAKRVAQLKDVIADTNERVKLFDPGNKFAAVGGAVSGLAAGFSAVQGAMGLAGVKSEELQKQLLRVQSAMALSQGISSVLDAGKHFTRLGAIVKTQVVSAFTTLRGAIISTGFGALVVGLGLLIANFDEVKKALFNLIPGLSKVADFIGGIIDKIKQFTGIGVESVEELNKKAIESTIDGLERQKKELEASGKSTIDIQKQIISERLKLVKKGSKDELDLKTDANVIDIRESKRVSDEKAAIDKAAHEKRKAELKKRADEIAAENKRIAEDGKKTEESVNNSLVEIRLNAQNLEVKKLNDTHQIKLASLKAANLSTRDEIRLHNIELRNLQDKFDAEDKAASEKRFNDFAESLPKITKARTSEVQKALNDEKIAREESLRVEQVVTEAKLDLTKKIGEALGAFSDLAGRETAAGKVLAVAQATINTYLGATQILSAKPTPGVPTPLAVAMKISGAATVIASGLASVKNILKVKTPGGGGAASLPTATAPLSALPQTTSTQIDQTQVSQIGNAASRSYIVESDVTNGQERIERLNRAARIG